MDVPLSNESKLTPTQTVNPNTRKSLIALTIRGQSEKIKGLPHSEKYMALRTFTEQKEMKTTIINTAHQLYIHKIVLSDSIKSHKKFWT